MKPIFYYRICSTALLFHSCNFIDKVYCNYYCCSTFFSCLPPSFVPTLVKFIVACMHVFTVSRYHVRLMSFTICDRESDKKQNVLLRYTCTFLLSTFSTIYLCHIYKVVHNGSNFLLLYMLWCSHFDFFWKKKGTDEARKDKERRRKKV